MARQIAPRSLVLTAGLTPLAGVALVALAVSTSPAAAQVDHACIEDPVFPSDCPTQLGPIGSPPLPREGEGFLHVSMPVIDPVLTVPSLDGAPTKLYVLNPLGDSVRVLDASDLSLIVDLRVCSGPSALARDEAGSRVYVSCVGSHAVGVIDVGRDLVIDVIQDRDGSLRPLLQEPMGLAVHRDTLWVASSANNHIVEIDLSTHRIVRHLPVPGQDPRDIALTSDGRFLVVANFMAGNRTEPVMSFNGAVLNEATPSGAVCGPLLADPTALAVALEADPNFMDTSHPEYPTIAECYFFAHVFGNTSTIAVNPVRSDHDLVVLDTATGGVVFSTNTLDDDLGTLNYALDVHDDNRVYLASTHSRNFLNTQFGNRPILNHLSILQLDPASGALALIATRDLDDPQLDDSGAGASIASIPHAIARHGDQLFVAAAGSDNLLTLDLDGNIVDQLRVGFGPKGVLATDGAAYVYESSALTVSRIDLLTDGDVLTQAAITHTQSIGPNGLSQSQRIGRRLFQSAQFSENRTFACASCHPDGHLDGLDWQLNDVDGIRSTMTIREISDTAAYHWDGSKCNHVKILQDGIVNLFGHATGPTDCEMKTMIDYMDGLVRPHSPHRAPNDGMSEQARLGAAVLHRARSKHLNNNPRGCTFRQEDPSVESFYLEAIGDPDRTEFNFNGGGGPFPNTLVAESCSVSNCHVAPHTESDGFRNGSPDEGLIDGFQAISTLGLWDRMISSHDARTTRAKFVEALEINRAFNGAEPINAGDSYTGRTAALGFTDGFFRHVEYNFDGDDSTHAFTLSSALSQFMMEEEELQAGAASLTVVLDAARRNDTGVNRLVALLQNSADQGKIALSAVGILGGAMTHLEWTSATARFQSDAGPNLTLEQLRAALIAGDAMVLYGAPLPGAAIAGSPKLFALERDTSPILCAEGYTDYQATARTGEFEVPLTLRTSDAIDGTRVLINGQVHGEPLTGGGPDFNWTLAQAPGEKQLLAVQLLAPNGMLSNSLPLPIVDPVVPAIEPLPVLGARNGTAVQFDWPTQVGLTGPGTRFDVYRGTLRDLRDRDLDLGECISPNGQSNPLTVDGEIPEPSDGFYYVMRAQNQVNVTTWGSPPRDQSFEQSANACTPLF